MDRGHIITGVYRITSKPEKRRLKMNRRTLLRRGMAGSVAALVGLPEQKYLKGEIKDAQVFDEALPMPEAKAAYQWPEPTLTIQHEGAYGHFCRTMAVPPDPGFPKWKTHRVVRPLEQTITLIGAWVTYDQWWGIAKNPVRLELHDATYIGRYIDADTTGYAPSDVGCNGDFTFWITNETT
jgi:hypothetical protein